MPFIQVDTKKAIRNKCAADPEFKEAWDESREEYRILARQAVVRNQELSPSAVSNRSNDEPNEVTYSVMESAEKDEDIYGPFCCVSKMMDNLNQ